MARHVAGVMSFPIGEGRCGEGGREEGKGGGREGGREGGLGSFVRGQKEDGNDDRKVQS